MKVILSLISAYLVFLNAMADLFRFCIWQTKSFIYGFKIVMVLKLTYNWNVKNDLGRVRNYPTMHIDYQKFKQENNKFSLIRFGIILVFKIINL